MSSSTFFLSALAFILSDTLSTTTATSCCLRKQPKERLHDGLSLQSSLIVNQHEDFKFIPNAPVLASNTQQLQVVKSIIEIMLQRDNLNLIEETNTISVHRLLINTVISDSCAYLAEVLQEKVNCNDYEELQALASRYELYTSIDDLFYKIDVHSRGSPKNHYAYWDENVQKKCTPCTCPRLHEIKTILRFVPNADQCSCQTSL